MATKGQGQRGLPGASTKGKTPGNPTKPKLAAKIKNRQGLGGGLRQGKGGAKFVSSARPGRGISQNGTGAKKGSVRVGQLKTNRSPISAQPKYAKKNPVQPKANFTLTNGVKKADVARMRKAHNMGMPPMSGGGFGKFIGK